MAYAGDYETTYTDDGGAAVYGDQDPSNPPPGFQWDARTGTFVPIAQPSTWWDTVDPPVTTTPTPAAPVGPSAVGAPDGGGGQQQQQQQQQFGVPTSGFGAAPTPYVSDPHAPQYTPMPTYVPPTWTGGNFENPTEQELFAMPGYQARMNAGLQARQRSAAAQGTILNGGTQKALARYAGEEAAQSYQTLRNNSYDAFVQRYKQFSDAAGMDLNARTINANENQNTFQNRVGTYASGNARTLTDYLTNLTGKRNSELDYWNRLQDVSGTGAQLAGGSR